MKQLDIASLCTRKEEKELQLDSNLAQVVIGVRRSGKSTLCQKVLIEKGFNFAYVNFDDERLRKAKTDDLDDVIRDQSRVLKMSPQAGSGEPINVSYLTRGYYILTVIADGNTYSRLFFKR